MKTFSEVMNQLTKISSDLLFPEQFIPPPPSPDQFDLEQYRQDLAEYSAITYPRRILERRWSFLTKQQKDEVKLRYYKAMQEEDLDRRDELLEYADEIIVEESERRNDPWR